MKIAIEGCCHGELDNIYKTLQAAELSNGIKIDLLLCCGDFQACRNESDLQTMACPPKYRAMHTFYQYYSGEKTAPIPTIFIGGNHEASNHLWELPLGGWVAENIFYLGYAGVVNFGGLRIGGLSGIFNERHFRLGHFEAPPYNDGSMRSAYHIREYEIFQLAQLKQPLDIFLSHDWPRNVAKFGDLPTLLRKKKFLRSEIEDGSLGSPPAEHLLHLLQPRYWFSAHLHVKYPAIVQHGPSAAPAVKDTDEHPDVQDATPSAGRVEMRATRFLALDKCLPNREFLQIVDFPHVNSNPARPLQIEIDEEWMAIVKSTAPLRSHTRKAIPLPPPQWPHGRWDYSATEEEMAFFHRRVAGAGTRRWPAEFGVTAPVHDPKNTRRGRNVPPAQPVLNPQTTSLCEFLDIPNPCAVFAPSSEALAGPQVRPEGHGARTGAQVSIPPPPLGRPGPPCITTSATLSLPPPSAFPAAMPAAMTVDPNKIDIDDDDDTEDDAIVAKDPNAIALDDMDDDDDDSSDAVTLSKDPNAIDVDEEDDSADDIEMDGNASCSAIGDGTSDKDPGHHVAPTAVTTTDEAVAPGTGAHGLVQSSDATQTAGANAGSQLFELPIATSAPARAPCSAADSGFVLKRRNRNVADHELDEE
eukprot:m.690576 g.690576  ORF g.690576 m.690576 type:complete len:641 (-) comp22851_c0_seq3:246-2168(-)